MNGVSAGLQIPQVEMTTPKLNLGGAKHGNTL
jgi:hypothetical protein